MPRIDEQYALLLHGIDNVETDLAQNLLEAAGIPCLAHGPDFDIAELGVAAHASIRGRDVYVPKDALARARDLVREAWGQRADEALAPDA